MKLSPHNLQEISSVDFLYNQLPSGFISYKPDGTVLKVNDTFSRWLNLSAEQVCLLNFKSLLTKACGLYYNLFVDPLLNVETKANEISLVFKSPNGNIDVLFNAVGYKNEQDHLILINASIQKITDRKKYESELLFQKKLAEEEKRKFEFLSNTVPNHIWTTTPDGVLISANKKATDYFNVDPIDFNDFNFVFEEDRKKAFNSWKKCLTSGKPFEREVRLLGNDRTPEWFLLTAEPFLNKDGVIELWIGSSTNIHKHKTWQIANYSTLKHSLVTAQKTIDQNAELFISIEMNKSHMIRKPLANMLGLLMLLEKETMSKECRNMFNLLSESAEELDAMIKS